MLYCKIGTNIGQVVIDPVAPRGSINPQSVIVAAVMDHRVNRPADDREQLPVGRRPLRIQARVTNEISVTLPNECPLLQVSVQANRWRIEEHLRDGAAVDMHLLKMLTTQLDIYDYRRKQTRHRGRGKEQLADQGDR